MSTHEAYSMHEFPSLSLDENSLGRQKREAFGSLTNTSAMMALIASIASAIVLLAAAAPTSWLDAKAPANWNVAGKALPARPGARDAELAPGGRCAASTRPATSLEDRALRARGWSLVGPYQRFGSTSVMFATASADGMCRPNGFQAFVFVNGVFAGTLSPVAMNARTDGSIASLNVSIFSATEISADFARYNDSDPLCCPHGTTNVLYQINAKPPLVVPTSQTTAAIAR